MCPRAGRASSATSSRRCRARPTRRSRPGSWRRSSADDLSEAELRALIEARLRRFRPRRGRAAAPARRQRLAARAVPRADARVQGRRPAAARAAVRAFPHPARARDHHRRRDLGRHRLGGDRGVRRARAHGDRDPASARADLRGPAPPDDHGHRRKRPQRRDRGHLRRLPGAAEGAVCRRGFPQPLRSRRDQLDQLGPDHRPGGVLRHRSGRVGRALAPGRLRRADRQLRRRVRRLRRRTGWACRSPS